MNPHSFQILERLVGGHHLMPSELDDLVNQKTREDLYLEYKSEKELLKVDSPLTVRQYMSGFANSAGGVLIIGIEAGGGEPTEVTGFKKGKNRSDLAEWASRCLTPIASYFSPIPIFHVVQHEKGDVLVGVVSRSLSLVPLTEKGAIVYHFRIHDQTLKAPDYLMADILLGRRQQPILSVIDYQVTESNRILINDRRNIARLALGVEFDIENLSFVWAEEIRWGLIAWVDEASKEGIMVSISEPSSYLLSFVSIKDKEPHLGLEKLQLLHIRGASDSDEPFRPFGTTVGVSLPFRIDNTELNYTWKAALYLTSKRSLPVWYQIILTLNKASIRLLGNEQDRLVSEGHLTVTNLVSERAVVALNIL